MPSLGFDPDYQRAIAPYASFPKLHPKNVLDLRHLNNTAISYVMQTVPCDEADQIIETTHPYTTTDGDTVTLHRFTPKAKENTIDPQPAILYLHGGGLVSGSVGLFRRDIIHYAALTQTTIFAPGYRLAPEAWYPKPLEDVWCALNYIKDHSWELNIDEARLALYGVSAGGGLAAGTALMARDKGLTPPLKMVVLVYPMLDDRTKLPEGDATRPYLTWSEDKNEMGWSAYLAWMGGEMEDYAAPGRAEDLSGMPKLYVDVGQLDLYNKESKAFAEKAEAAGGDVEFHEYTGVPHAWEWLAPNVPVTKRAVENRVRALREL